MGPSDIPDFIWRRAEELARRRGFMKFDDDWSDACARYAGELMADYSPGELARALGTVVRANPVESSVACANPVEPKAVAAFATMTRALGTVVRAHPVLTVVVGGVVVVGGLLYAKKMRTKRLQHRNYEE